MHSVRSDKPAPPFAHVAAFAFSSMHSHYPQFHADGLYLRELAFSAKLYYGALQTKHQ